jgi:hypothetical protein
MLLQSLNVNSRYMDYTQHVYLQILPDLHSISVEHGTTDFSDRDDD